MIFTFQHLFLVRSPDGGFILSDCEGYETSLFSADVIGALSRSDLIIELHDGLAPAGTTRQLLREQFGTTHRVQVVQFRPRDYIEFSGPVLAAMLGADAIRVISEEGTASPIRSGSLQPRFTQGIQWW